MFLCLSSMPMKVFAKGSVTCFLHGAAGYDVIARCLCCLTSLFLSSWWRNILFVIVLLFSIHLTEQVATMEGHEPSHYKHPLDDTGQQVALDMLLFRFCFITWSCICLERAPYFLVSFRNIFYIDLGAKNCGGSKVSKCFLQMEDSLTRFTEWESDLRCGLLSLFVSAVWIDFMCFDKQSALWYILYI